jgi:phenylacetate-CoA ligase
MAGAYEWLFRRVLYPVYESGIRRRKTLAYLAEYERNQWLSEDEIAAIQWRKLAALIQHCWQEVPYYQRRWRELDVAPGDIRSIEDYAKLPLLTKQDIRDNTDDLKATSLRDRLVYKATGGSTGEPLRFGYTRESHERRNAVMWRGYGWAGSRMGRRTLYLWGIGVGSPTPWKRFKENAFHATFGRKFLNSFGMTEANLVDYADAIDRYRPEIIVAYVAPLVELARWLLATGRKPVRPEAIITGAEALHDAQRQVLEQAFGCPVFNTYGCREFMLIASECEQRDGMHIHADHLAVELLDARSDQPGDVVITDLHNYGMPFLRYVNGDIATPRAHGCACGRGLPMLSHVEGRRLDTLRTPSGKILPGELIVAIFLDAPGIKRYQVTQRTLDSLDLTLVRGPDFDDATLSSIRRRVEALLDPGMALRIGYAEDIPLLRSGKTRVTVSLLDPAH